MVVKEGGLEVRGNEVSEGGVALGLIADHSVGDGLVKVCQGGVVVESDVGWFRVNGEHVGV